MMTPKALADLLVQQPTGTFPPPTPKALRPVGVGDLNLVREHTVAYEGGDISHVENVLRGEYIGRQTRRLDRSEATYLQEAERTVEEQRDTQTTEHLSLKREIAQTLRDESESKTGFSMNAKYGAFMSISTSVNVGSSTSTESSTRSATEYARDVVARASSKLTERVLERRTSTTISEFEEKYEHGIDNRRASEHVAGVYQWLDRVVEAQVYNHGSRLLFDIIVPEPATSIILAQAENQGAKGIKPTKWIDVASDKIHPWNYRQFAKAYGVTNLEVPPDKFRIVSKTLSGQANDQGRPLADSDSLEVPTGYAAISANVSLAAVYLQPHLPTLQFVIGTKTVTLNATNGYNRVVSLSDEIDSLAFGVVGHAYLGFALNVEVLCKVTDRALDVWREKVYAALVQGYMAKQQEYTRALADSLAIGVTADFGRNPTSNARIISDELRLQCIERLSEQHFEALGALELSVEGYAQVDLLAAERQEPYIRFFEHAFEWEAMSAAFYPYFWGLKDGWRYRQLLDNVDSKFAEFLTAGAARVVFAARPGFEEDVVHYLETGEIWSGNGQPDIHSSNYWPIVEEIRSSNNADDKSKAVGKPWKLALPTTLVRLRTDDDLPKWELNATGDWISK